MALVKFKIDERYNPTEADYERLSIVIDEYNIAFNKQEEIMLKELGVSIPVGNYGKFLALVKCIVIPEKSKFGIIKPDITIEEAKKEHNIGLVVGIGPEAFRDRHRFPFGPNCKVGMWINFSRYESAPIKINGFDCRLVMDDKINLAFRDLENVQQSFPELF